MRGQSSADQLSLVCRSIHCDTSFFLSNSCWDTNDQSIPWWVIRMPILISIVVSSSPQRSSALLFCYVPTLCRECNHHTSLGPITSRALPGEGWALRRDDQSLGLQEVLTVCRANPAVQITTVLCSSALNAHMRSSLVQWADIVPGVHSRQILYVGGKG